MLFSHHEAWCERLHRLRSFSARPPDVRNPARPHFHRSWNDFLEYPSVENICELLSAKLKDRLLFPFTLRVWEGDGKWAETDSSERDA